MATIKKERVSFAKICVELPVDYSFNKEMELDLGGRTVILGIEYPWVPQMCKTCRWFGHKVDNCPKVSRVWKERNMPQNVTLEKWHLVREEFQGMMNL